jgi:hypothetical protein
MVVADGFNRRVCSDIILDSNHLRRVDAELQIGDTGTGCSYRFGFAAREGGGFTRCV